MWQILLQAGVGGRSTLDGLTILLLGLGSIIAFGLWAWWLTKREKKPFGEVLSVMAVHQNESIFVFIVMAIFFSEAVLAASVTPPGETPPPPLARFISHTVISICGAVASVTLIRDMASAFEKGLDWKSRIARTFVLSGVFILAIGIPIANAALIAAGLGEDLEFRLFLVDKFFFWVSEEEFLAEVRFYGGGYDYQSWSNLSYIMKTTAVLTMVHMLITIIEGFRNVSSEDRRRILFDNPYLTPEDKEKEEKQKAREEAKKGAEGSTFGEQRAMDKVDENLKFLLHRCDYTKSEELDPVLKAAKNNLYKAIKSASDRIYLAVKIAELRTEATAMDNRTDLSEDTRKTLKAELRTKIRTLFENKPKPASGKQEDLGLGVQLKGGNRTKK